MPIITSDDDVLAYRGRWQGPPGVWSFQVGVYYEALFGTFGAWVAEAVLLAGVTLLLSPLAALVVALVLTVGVAYATVLDRQRRLLLILGAALLAVLFLGLPLLPVLLAPWVHAPLIGRLIGRVVDSDRSLGQWLAVLRAEAAAPRGRAVPATTYLTGPAPATTPEAPRL